MIYNNINTNIGGKDFQKLVEGIWEIGLISENPGLDDISSDFYKTITIEKTGNDKSDHKCFKNKVSFFPLLFIISLCSNPFLDISNKVDDQ